MAMLPHLVREHRHSRTKLSLNRLDLEELFEPERARLASYAGLLVPTERSIRVECSAVHLDLPGPQLPRDAIRAIGVT